MSATLKGAVLAVLAWLTGKAFSENQPIIIVLALHAMLCQPTYKDRAPWT